jgi:hypothetical protein
VRALPDLLATLPTLLQELDFLACLIYCTGQQKYKERSGRINDRIGSENKAYRSDNRIRVA